MSRAELSFNVLFALIIIALSAFALILWSTGALESLFSDIKDLSTPPPTAKPAGYQDEDACASIGGIWKAREGVTDTITEEVNKNNPCGKSHYLVGRDKGNTGAQNVCCISIQ